ncbi:MAG: DUF134 domain-containing protein [Methanoculleaceae archaeon]
MAMNPAPPGGWRHGRGRGRGRISRRISGTFEPRCFAPVCDNGEPEGAVYLRPDEFEVLRLVDLEGLHQEEAASRLGISRKTVWRDLHGARRKIADALVHGREICVVGCTRPESECGRTDGRPD